MEAKWIHYHYCCCFIHQSFAKPTNPMECKTYSGMQSLQCLQCQKPTMPTTPTNVKQAYNNIYYISPFSIQSQFALITTWLLFQSKGIPFWGVAPCFQDWVWLWRTWIIWFFLLSFLFLAFLFAVLHVKRNSRWPYLFNLFLEVQAAVRVTESWLAWCHCCQSPCCYLLFDCLIQMFQVRSLPILQGER